MSVAQDKHMASLNQFHYIRVIRIHVPYSCSYRIILVTLSVGVEAATSDKVTRLMADFGCFYFESDTIEDQPFCVVECIVSITMKNNYTAHDDEGNWTTNELKLMYWEKDRQPQNMTVTQTRTISYWEDE